MKTFNIFVTILLFTCGLLATPAQNNQNALLCADPTADHSNSINQLEKTITAEMVSKKVPGVSVVVVCDNRIIYKKSFGVKSIETKNSASTGDLFRLGSTTKMFVALAVINLSEKGIIDMDAPIGKYAKELHPKLASLTLNQLLRHTSGLKDDAPQRGRLDENALRERVISWNETAFFTAPDNVFSYSNPGYVLASFVLEKATGKPFADVVRENVFSPLGMRKSTFRPLTAMTYPFVQGHMPTPKGMKVVRPFAENAANWAPGSMFSNVEELGQFLIAFFNTDKMANGQKTLASSLNLLKIPKSDVIALDRKYGYGLVRFRERGVNITMHTGGRLGFGSIIWTVPEKRFGVAILANSPAIFTTSVRKAMALSIPVKPTQPSSKDKVMDISVEELNRIVGVYTNNNRIRTELISKDGTLMIRFANREFKVDKVGGNRFQALGGGPLTRFVITDSPDGKARYLHAEYWALKQVK